ncbi:MAG: sigma-70 family RNA polymerase sigma factor [Bacteroidales bacterium]|nr:sigma-70 family RNA polymerase sigma factor [Bacteroidales bacterium]MDT8374452.1 sigma-70 family RNA polymerase sigma factor [Bacteroidales bacterium]
MGKGTLHGHEFSETDLVRRCAEGDIRSQELLYRRYFSFAMSICIRYTSDENEAMEIVNDSYMKVLDSLDGYDHSRPFKSWYGKILVNTAIDNYRKTLKSNEHISIDTITDAGEIDPEIEAELSVNDILALYSYLPANYKITFNLFEIEGYSHEEIGRMMGVTASTSRANLTRAKKMLRELYNRHIILVRKSHE